MRAVNLVCDRGLILVSYYLVVKHRSFLLA
jgi:hypothetical protein